MAPLKPAPFPSLAKVRATIEAKFPELNIRESWSVPPYPRILRIDLFHHETQAEATAVRRQIEGLFEGVPGVSFGWCGAEVEIKIERNRRT